MTSVAIPQSSTQQLDSVAMQRLLDIMCVLRQQCPWDIKQTPLSLSKYAIEEAYEVADAIRKNLPSAFIADELGDLLLQVIFQSEMYAQQQQFDINAVVATLSAKLIRRHPHVFDKAHYPADDAQAVALLWQNIKDQEKAAKAAHGDKPQYASLLDEVEFASSLHYAQNIQAKAATVGFDWPDLAQTFAKVHEEIAELNAEIAKAQLQHNLPAAKDTPAYAALTDELGDCLFALVNVARKLGVNSEDALNSTITKFKNRFTHIETEVAKQGKVLTEVSLAQMDEIWNLAKLKQK